QDFVCHSLCSRGIPILLRTIRTLFCEDSAYGSCIPGSTLTRTDRCLTRKTGMLLKKQLALLLFISGAQVFAQEQAPAPSVPPPSAPPATTTTAAATTPLATATDAPVRVGGDVHGVVKAGNTPVPGVTISAANTLTGKKVVTTTDIDGGYALHLP